MSSKRLLVTLGSRDTNSEYGHLPEKPGQGTVIRGRAGVQRVSGPDILGEGSKQENQQELSWSGRPPATDAEEGIRKQEPQLHQPLVRVPCRLEFKS